MKIQWLGCAGFRLASRESVILMDPYLSRNARARPIQPLKPEDLGHVSHIFISHGHFDHLMDIPVIARKTGAKVVCDPIAARTLENMGMEKEGIIQVKNRHQEIRAGEFAATAFYSRHIRFDAPLVWTTLRRLGKRIFKMIPLFIYFPCGQVLSWRLEAEGKSLHFFGSAGSGTKELAALAEFPLDLLLIPLQGHSQVCGKGIEYLKALNPEMVIPHHFDDFYPPLSGTVDIEPFIKGVEKALPGIRVRVPEINQEMIL